MCHDYSNITAISIRRSEAPSLSLCTNCFVVESNVSADKDNTSVLMTEVQRTHVSLFLQQTVWV